MFVVHAGDYENVFINMPEVFMSGLLPEDCSIVARDKNLKTGLQRRKATLDY
jgi:hypothetical protein